MERKLSVLKALILLVPIIFNFECSSKKSSIVDRNEIAEVSGKMIKLLNARSYDQWITYLTDNAALLPPGSPPVTGKIDIRKLLSETMKNPDLFIVHHTLTIKVSRSRDMAYVRYMFDVKISRDTTSKSKFKDLSIFVKGNDGQWKLLYDMWSPNGSLQ